jgi:superfamily II DNA or RNA helicase
MPPITELTQRGYSVLKSDISRGDLVRIKNELSIAPCVPGAPVQSKVTFPAYRESPSKLYVPRYYGVSKFGPPTTNRIPRGDDIDLAFAGSLKPVQEEVVATYLDHVRDDGGGGLIQLPCGFGKTVVANYLIASLRKKTLIIVNTEMLMNQWIERIEQFLPGARVGRIRGSIIDTEDKDIVVGMLMSLSTKDYDTSVFAQFGFVVVDEVHHIASETFSRSLFKNSTYYMLGLSATMDRKDGTTFLFKMFLGEVVAKRERPKDDGVLVRGIEYADDDNECYSAMETDFRGNTASSKMVTKISTYAPRSEFILRVLTDMIAENPAQQILVLAQYKVLLKYLHDAIEHRQIAPVGYYVGGMKQAALEVSATKQIIVATYTMAAEGLDIKSLTTLVMASPMTSVEQPVGRILRERHEFAPMVVDIVDGHRNFQNQWGRRRAFYKSQGYDIFWKDTGTYLAGGNWTQLGVAKGAKKAKKAKVSAAAADAEDLAMLDLLV